MKTVSTGMLLLLLIGSVGVAAPAKHIKGDKASELSRALKFAGVKAKVTKSMRTFSAATINCSSTKEGTDEQLGDYTCSVDKLSVRDAAALLLQNTMESAGLSSSDGMSMHKTTGSDVSCVVDPAKSGDDRFDCTFTQGGM